MPNFFLTEKIDKTTYLQIKSLFNICSDFDKTNYILPSFEEMYKYSLFIFAKENNHIVGVIWNSDEILNEVFGMVLPEFRRQGLFGQLLSQLKEIVLDDLTFYGKPEYLLMTECAKAFGFTVIKTELLMKYQEISEPTEWEHEVFENDDTFSYYIDDNFIGSCSIFETDNTINIFEVFVEETYRNKGYATKIINDVLWSIKNSQKEILLQVSQENIPAVRCYQKCGFIVTDAIVFFNEAK